MTQEEKIKSIKSIFWDYVVDPQETLRHIEAADVDETSLRRLFVRCFERLKWDDVVDIWGIDRCLDMESDEVRRMIRPQLRDKYDRIYAALHRKPIPLSEQEIKDIRKFITPFLTHRWRRIGFRLGSPVKIPCGYHVDSLENILTDKLSAIVGRSEIKDVVDLVKICNNSSFSWDRMLEAAGRKEAMVSASLLVDFLDSVPISELDKIEWIRKPDSDEFGKNLTAICDDMLRKGPNSLALENRKIRTCLDCSPANGRNPEPAKPHSGSFSLKD